MRGGHGCPTAAAVGAQLTCRRAPPSSYFPHKTMWRSFFCAVVAGFVIRTIAPTFNTGYAYLEISYKSSYYWCAPRVALACRVPPCSRLFTTASPHQVRAAPVRGHWLPRRHLGRGIH